MKVRITGGNEVIHEDDFAENEWFFIKYDDYYEVDLAEMSLAEFEKFDDELKRVIWDLLTECI